MGEEKREITMEQKILEAAEELFLEKGFACISTTQIAREAGCNQALVHYYFRTKENLFQKIFEEKIRFFATSFLAIDKEGGTFEERLIRKIETHFDVLRKNPKLASLIVNEVITNPARIDGIKEKVGELPLKILATFQTDLDAEIKKGVIRNILLADFLMNILFMNVSIFVFAPVFQRFTGASNKDIEALLEHRKKENVEIILRSLRP